jgi:acetylornithine deacetylase/succinyl-diaminopimelate desuccinylase-like protein
MPTPVQQKLRDKTITPKKWADMVKPGEWINRGGPGSDTTVLMEALAARLGGGAGDLNNIEVWNQAVMIGNGFLADTTGPAYQAARDAMRAAWGIDASYAASGGSIPLVDALHRAVPEAEILLLGTTDGYANIHAPNERVLLEEFEKAVLVETEFLDRFAELVTNPSSEEGA